jgi:phytol kinase
MDLKALMMQDGLATITTFAIALAWLRLIDTLASRKLITSQLSRKIIHTGTGPLFVLSWFLYSEANYTRYLAAAVPLVITLQFIAVGTGLIDDPAAIEGMTRNNNPREILKGPLYYGIIFVLCTLLFWRDSPAGILALMILCGGDGLADIVGRRWGTHKLPFNRDKSWLGSTAMFLGSFGFGWSFVALFNTWGYFTPPLAMLPTTAIIALIAFIATLIEALPLQDVDNLLITGIALACGTVWLG